MSRERKVVGVLGGMGPGATIDFMSKVLAFTPARKDQDHIHLIVDQNPTVPSRQDALLRDGEDPGPALAAMARRLETAGADFLVIPCNSAHAFADSMADAVSIPLVSMIDETMAAIPDECGTIGLLGTAGCLKSGVYQRALDERALKYVEPSGEEMRELMRCIYAIKAGDTGPAVGESLGRLARALVERGADAVIAACTEIPLVLEQSALDVPLLSSTDILAKRTVQIAFSE
jgi:aspartate racemase